MVALFVAQGQLSEIDCTINEEKSQFSILIAGKTGFLFPKYVLGKSDSLNVSKETYNLL